MDWRMNNHRSLRPHLCPRTGTCFDFRPRSLHKLGNYGRNTSCSRIGWMSPHKQDPAWPEVQLDLSEILIRPEEVDREEVESGNAFPNWTDSSLDVRDTRISSSGLANISCV